MEAKKERGRTEDLVLQLQQRKGEMMREEEQAKQSMKIFFGELR
jgi:hypothetical protein